VRVTRERWLATDLGMVMDKCKGGEDTRRTSITGRLSWRGRESYKRKMVGYKLKIAQEIKRKISNLRQFLSFSYIQLSTDMESEK